MPPRNYIEQTAIGKKFFNIEYKLVLFFFYIGFLLFMLIYERDIKVVVWAHVSFVLIFSIFYYGRQFLYILFGPVIAIITPIRSYRIKRYLKNYKQNQPADVAIVLAHSNWTMLEAWIKPNFCLKELKLLVKYLKAKRQDFSFYPNASFGVVEKIMSDNLIKEVYFWGHGSSHTFQLGTNNILYYCEFNNSKYGKDFVHQIHCGTEDGKSLIDYVVPKENQAKCFFFRKPINSFNIEKEFKRRTKNFTK